MAKIMYKAMEQIHAVVGIRHKRNDARLKIPEVLMQHASKKIIAAAASEAKRKPKVYVKRSSKCMKTPSKTRTPQLATRPTSVS